MSRLEFFRKYFLEHREASLKKLKEFLAFETISSLSSSKKALVECATWLKSYIESIGGTVELWGEPPVVFAHFPCSVKNAPTVLIYNHYDVQPVDPLSEWDSPPFEATEKEGSIFARGAQDNKGQCFFGLLALAAMQGKLPCSIKLVIEGEEENGSSLLSSIASQKAKKLKADYTMIMDVGMRSESTPAITLGTRGLTSLTVKVTGPNQDLHSGSHGGIAKNPLHALVSMLSSLWNEDGSIAIPGFYDSVHMPSDMKDLDLHMDEAAWTKEFGQLPTGGEKKLLPLVRNWLRPTIEINGIHGGYGGEGTKTVIPKEAFAKISCRLVSAQDPAAVAEMVKTFLLKKSPPGITTEITIHEGMGRATRTKADMPLVSAIAASMKEVWGVRGEFILDGASIPVAPLLEEASGGALVMWGVGLPTDRIHSPNERFSIDRLEKGFLTLCLALEMLPKTS